MRGSGEVSQLERAWAEGVRLRDAGLKGTYSTGDNPLLSFYIPSLRASHRYDRMAGYYSSTVLKVTARGIVPFIRNAQELDGGMRLIVGTQLSPADVAAIREGVADRGQVIEAAARGADIMLSDDGVGNEYLKLLGWMVREQLLNIKVGVPVDKAGLPLAPDEARGYFHSKYGILTDATNDQVAFIGSDNETAAGWLYNHETFSVAKSWLEQVWEDQGHDIQVRFNKHWDGHPDSGWTVFNLTDVDDRLLKLVTHDYMPPDHDPIWAVLDIPVPTTPTPPPPVSELAAWAELEDLRDAPTKAKWTAVGTAPAEPLPHQANLIDRVVSTYPRGYLLADEVGLGKTIEAGLVLRELMLSGAAKKALLLVPASVMKQWQEELREKIGLDVPRYTGSGFIDLNDEPVTVPAGNPWSALPIVLASSHLARRKSRRQEIVDAGPWDLVLVDEAHHARRKGSKPLSTPNSLLALLQEMWAKESWQALYLASATPMQMNAHEAWDLIELLGLPGAWGRSAADFTGYYERLRPDAQLRDWKTLSAMLGDYFTQHPPAERDADLERQIEDSLGFATSYKILGLDKNPLTHETAASLTREEADLADLWLRRHTPMRDRVFRNTRETLRDYQTAGIIGAEVVIPNRHVNDVFIPLNPYERALYERIEDYIRRHYNTYKTNQTTQALGFIMTVYRRRLTSSFESIRCSLRRRLHVLESGASLNELLADDDQYALEDALFDPEDFDTSATLLHDEITELRAFIADLDKITGEDTKAQRLVTDLNVALLTYSSVVVFTQYADTMKYVRERLVTAGYRKLGCYSGHGGEIYDPTTHTWALVAKAYLKQQFRDGQINVLIGTDSMSEGLNLQTCGRLFNYDMPWNLMRVEQRIGRVDRIGATYKDIRVTNYFYADTVEQKVYEGIAQDYDDFTEIVGNAQPVLAAVEMAIEQLVFALPANRDHDITESVAKIREDITRVGDRAVQYSDIGKIAVIPPPVLVGDVTLDTLEQVLITNPLTATRFTTVDGRDGVYRLALNGDTKTVTFRRKAADDASDDTTLLTYGNPVLNALFEDVRTATPAGI